MAPSKLWRAICHPSRGSLKVRPRQGTGGGSVRTTTLTVTIGVAGADMPAPVAVRAGGRAAASRRDHPGRASRDHHPSKTSAADAAPGTRPGRATPSSGINIAPDATSLDLKVGTRTVRLTNLQKVFWPDDRITKGDLVRYYAAVAPVLLPHL